MRQTKKTTSNERPFPMRFRKADLRYRVKGDLSLRFTNKSLTSYAGLELVRRYFRRLRLAEKIRHHVLGHVPNTDYGVGQMVMLLLTMLILGGRRVRHVLYLREDPLVQRASGLKQLPVPCSIGRWLGKFRVRHLAALHRLNEEIVAAVVRILGLRRLTIDVDGSVVYKADRNVIIRTMLDDRVNGLRTRTQLAAQLERTKNELQEARVRHSRQIEQKNKAITDKNKAMAEKERELRKLRQDVETLRKDIMHLEARLKGD